jgi:17beta-estradiol 17-dehydrogenase / very-long-chain 3-oxoacyl-CoA reductase
MQLSNVLNLSMENPFNLLHFLALIGTFLVFYVVACSLDFIVFHFTSTSKPLQLYRRPYPEHTYALITGGNGGIGYGIALALVKNGFGVILLGRNGAKLAAAAERLRDALVLPNSVQAQRDEYVKTMVLDPQTATPEEIEESVHEAIINKGLRVSILVNNVGSAPIAYPPYRGLSTYSAKDIDNTINLNARFMAHLTTRMLPVLQAARVHEDPSRRSLILNLSSGANIGLPYQVMYSSTKAFNSAFSVGLSRDLKADPNFSHVDVLGITAGDVESQNNIAGLTKGSPDSEAYGTYIVEKVDGAIRRGLMEMTPYWPHHLDFVLLSVTPLFLVNKGILDIMVKKRDAMNEVMKPKNE